MRQTGRKQRLQKKRYCRMETVRAAYSVTGTLQVACITGEARLFYHSRENSLLHVLKTQFPDNVSFPLEIRYNVSFPPEVGHNLGPQSFRTATA